MSLRHDIRVAVRAEYLDEPSDVDEKRYVFSYRVRIENHGSLAATLLSRHWVITDGDEKVQEVRGEGVLGQQPTLAPGGVHEYASGAVIATPVGAMRGSYTFVDAEGTSFEAPIPAFTLAVPRALH